MGYSGTVDAHAQRTRAEGNATTSQTQPIITGPIEQTSAIPLPTPSPSPAPSMVSAMTAPPPYSGSTVVTGANAYKPPAQPTYVQAPRPAATPEVSAPYSPNAYRGYSGPGGF